MTALLAGVPDSEGIVTDALGGLGGFTFDKVAEGIATWILGAVEFFVTGALDFLRSSSTPNLSAVWFSGKDSPYAAVRNVAAFLLVGFVFLGIIQGLLNGDTAGMVRRMAGHLPAAVTGMVVAVAVVDRLLALTDAMSDAVLAGTDDQALHFLSGFGATVTSATGGFAAVLLGLVAVVAGLLLWIELIVRSALIYILVAIAPLGFAATLWPSARGLLRKTVELLLAVIVSKLVICIALVIGVAALSGAGTATAANGAGTAARSAALASNAGAGVGALLVGAVVLGLAAFAPFIVLKLVPVAEAAVVAQGVSRGPWRATQTGISSANAASTVARLAGGKTTGTAGGSGLAGQAGAPGATGAASAPSVAGGPAGAATAAGSTVVSGAARAARGAADTTARAADTAAAPQSSADAPRPGRSER